jgi:hypothetical protein
VKPQRFDQQRLCQMPRHQRAPWLGITQFAHHPFDQPAQRLACRFGANMNDGRQDAEE